MSNDQKGESNPSNDQNPSGSNPTGATQIDEKKGAPSRIINEAMNSNDQNPSGSNDQNPTSENNLSKNNPTEFELTKVLTWGVAEDKKYGGYTIPIALDAGTAGKVRGIAANLGALTPCTATAGPCT